VSLELLAMVVHAWEDTEHGAHVWDDWAEDSDNDMRSDADIAADAFLEILLGLYYSSSLPATFFCQLLYWAAKFGMPGVAKKYGLPPGRRSGSYQEHLDNVLDFKGKKQNLYKCEAPGLPSGGVSRGPVTFTSKPGHESLNEEFDDPSFSVRLRECLDNPSELPPCYDAHPTVLRHAGESVAPVAMYMDGVAYSQVDSVLAIWLINLVTQTRHLMMLVRKKVVCRCGCKGWCTYFVVLSWIKWVLSALEQGVHPDRRHDGSGFLANLSDKVRSQKAGIRLRFRAACLWIKGDWQEFVERLGFPTWQSYTRPCFCCNAFGELLYDSTCVSLVSEMMKWHINQDADYAIACQRCEIWVEIKSARELSDICDTLHYDKRDDGSRGLALTEGHPDMEPPLLVGDRLEPHASCMDVEAVENISVFPCLLLFWRRTRETLCTHRCPLFDETLGISPTRSIAIDIMHTLFLAPIPIWCGIVLWMLLKGNIWGAFESTNEERVKVSVLACRAALLMWYADEQRAGRFHTRVNYISRKMLGSEGSATKLKAMEAYGFLQFLLHMLSVHRQRFENADALIVAGEAVHKMVQLMKISPVRLPMSTTQDPCL
jgi:hypothetical protein